VTTSTDPFEEPRRFWRAMWHLPRVAHMALTVRPGNSPSDVVFQRGRFSLRRYRRTTPARYAEPILFCYALINRPYILDLLPQKSVVERYLAAGFDVYLIDWGTPTNEDRGLTLEDHVCGFLAAAASFVAKAHRRKDLHLLGYCMGGTMATLLTALTPDMVRTLTVMAAPLDFSGREGLLNLWTDPSTFDVDALVDTYGNCPAWFLQNCFLFMKPVQNLIEKNIAFYENLDDADAVATYFAMERWLNDNIPIPGETFRQFVKDLYQRNALVRGELRLGERRVDPKKIACPLLLLTAANDHLVTPASTLGLRPHVASCDVQAISVDAGHVGLVVGGRAHRRLWPAATSWTAERSTPKAG
jgi:polyhydroxyalkanoate synthase subunit PhaC